MLPGWIKPPPFGHKNHGDATHQIALSRDRSTPIFLREVAEWEIERQRMLFQILVPINILAKYHIDPVKLTDTNGRPVGFVHVNPNRDSFRFELFHVGDAAEPMGELELGDTQFNQIEVIWVALQDPTAPRYDIDVLPGGSTMRGTSGRNIVAEEAAMNAGLAPGQVRQGLRSFGWLAERIEIMMLCLNQREYMAQPLFYHTAILFEQYGFGYVQGQSVMEEVNAEFGMGGALRAQLDGSSPFRQPALADSIRGRSWAIHDGIMGRRWDRVRMVKRLGADACVQTSPGVPW